AGIAARRRHIFPSWKAKLFAVVAAVAPDLLPPFSRLV
ncbi:MAG: short-chain dehydrogenase, partial [Chloroflexus aggregans]